MGGVSRILQGRIARIEQCMPWWSPYTTQEGVAFRKGTKTPCACCSNVRPGVDRSLTFQKEPPAELCFCAEGLTATVCGGDTTAGRALSLPVGPSYVDE